MFGDEYIVKARVETLGGLSAHAGRRELLGWIEGFQPQPRTLIVHGETAAQEAMAEKLWQDQQLKVGIPSRGERVVL